MKKKKRIRFFALLLTLCMCVGMMPASAAAADDPFVVSVGDTTAEGQENDDDYTTEYHITENDAVVSVSGSTENSRIIVEASNVTITLDDVSMVLNDCNGSPIEITKGKSATLILKGENRLTAYAAGPGLLVSQDASLTIKAGNSEGTDRLEVNGAEMERYTDQGGISGGMAGGFAGIGGPNSGSALIYTGTICIESGIIHAVGYGYGAGIGGGDYSSGGTIDISGGNITAICGGTDPNGWASATHKQASGIGGSQGQASGKITISGEASVKAYGGYGCAGIGGGTSDVTIRGCANVEAYGGEKAAGIGGYDQNKGKSSISILDTAQVAAYGGKGGSGIGQGENDNAVFSLNIAETASAHAYSDGNKPAVVGTPAEGSTSILNIYFDTTLTIPKGIGAKLTVKDSADRTHELEVPSGCRAAAVNTAEGICTVSVSVASTTTVPLHAVDADNIAAGAEEAFYMKGIMVATPLAPSAPENISAVSGDGQVILTWDMPENDGGYEITGYKVYYDTSAPSSGDAESQNALTVNDGSVTAATVTGLNNNTDYYFWVKAVNAIGEGKGSEPVICAPFPAGTSVDVRSAKQLEIALENDAITDINVTDSFVYENDIIEEKNITVKSGNTLTLEYSTGFSFPYNTTVCNSNVTVEDGAEIIFCDVCWWSSFWSDQPSLHSYLLMNGDFILEEGAQASTDRSQSGNPVTTPGYLLFRGGFANSGKFTLAERAEADVYLNYGAESGEFTGGDVKYNLCVSQPETMKIPTEAAQIGEMKISLTEIKGDPYVGGQLYVSVDGFGEVKQDGLFPVVWNETDRNALYTVPKGSEGKRVSASLEGNFADEYGYFFVVDTEYGSRAYQITAFDTAEHDVQIAAFTVHLNANGGTCETEVLVPNNEGKLGNLPVPVRPNYTFEGWYTESSSGEEITGETVFEEESVIYAHWKRNASSGGSAPTYPPQIEQPENGDVSVSPKYPQSGDKVTVAPEPDEGFAVGEVIVTGENGDAVKVADNGDGTYTFRQPAGRVTIQVVFRPEECDGGADCPASLLIDVDKNAWYHKSVDYMIENGMMNGTSETTFLPDSAVTRGMIVEILYRLEGEPGVKIAAEFSDVADGQYYADAVAWAAGNEIVTGYSKEKFGPDDAITREQLAAILYRYAQYKNIDVTRTADLSGYTDTAQISAYAETAVKWANAEGLITGVTDTMLKPAGTATRAQAAEILMRFCEHIAE